MRISDWSSDVCSSDLRERIGEDAVQRFGDRLGGVGLEIGRRLQRRVGRGHRDAPLADMWIVAVTVRTHIGSGITSCNISMTAIEQIGRASCRERVWQYG